MFSGGGHNSDTGEDLVGPEARKKIVERANTIEAFNKALTKLDPSSKKQSQPQGKDNLFGQRLSWILQGWNELNRHPVSQEGLQQARERIQVHSKKTTLVRKPKEIPVRSK